MPDVSRSDSLRSDTDSSRPRVSFNRDVHVKRIVSGDSPVVLGALSGDGAGHLIPTPVRRERLGKLTKRQLEEEAAKVLDQAESVDCKVTSGSLPEKYYTLPARRKQRRGSSDSQDSKLLRRHSEELSQSPPRKPPRAFTSTPKLNIFKRNDRENNTNLHRSRSDVSNLKSKTNSIDRTALVRKRSGSESDDIGHVKTKKTQLSPIIEVVQREDYFSNRNKDNVDGKATTQKDDKKLKNNEIEVIVIDVDNAKDITKKTKKINGIRNKLKSLSFRNTIKTNQNDNTNSNDNTINETKFIEEVPQKSPRIKEAIKILEKQSKLTKSTGMIHSSQQPPDKPPLTRGKKVDTMVKKLNTDKNFMPPKTNIMVQPTLNVQHNNNQPFSYTQPRNLSPERTRPKSPSSPIIYAQVVVQNGDADNPGPNKQTIHTVYNGGNKKHLQHSDSDEGLGYEDYRKYDNEKSFTRFGDDKIDFYKDVDKFDEEFPITPKFKSNYTNGYSYNEYKTDRNGYIDSSTRGRGDGMDSRRRESLTEIPLENKPQPNFNGRSDLSYRRDLLESRINSRRIGEKITINHSTPEYNTYSPKIEKYISEKSRYYRNGSNSPIGFTEKYTETKISNETKNLRHYDTEPKSLDSQLSDYRSSPENINTRKNYYTQRSDSPRNNYRSIQQINRYKKSDKLTKDHYKSNPEINYKYDDRQRFVNETYHSSLRRQKTDSSTQHKYYEEEERKDKFGDSGIENDLRRDSGDRQRNDSEDEGFASSLLIASEKHNDDIRRQRKEYDSDREARIYDKDHSEHAEYRRSARHEYVHRERSIDDGSHFDPRIDKDIERSDNKNIKKNDKKPPKPVKKTSLEKVKSLFSGSKKKREKEEPPKMVREESLRARYTEYRGSDSRQGSRTGSRRDINSDSNPSYEYNSRRRMSTPSPSPTRETNTKQDKDSQTSAGWFKSLDSRLSRKKEKTTSEKETITEDELIKPPATKNLRFFGDTDIESNDSIRYKSSLKPRSGLQGGRTSSNKVRSQSTRDLHNISEELRDSDDSTIRRNDKHKSLQNVTEVRGSKINLKPPASPSRRSSQENRNSKDAVRRGRRGEASSVESSTEGDSSQQSQRSVVYLHAATVGDIPGPGYLRGGNRRAASREELASLNSSRMQPQIKTLSRSFSMLAPWKPRHPSETRDIDYSTPLSRTSKSSGKTAKERSNKKLSENRKSNQNLTTLNRRSRSKENISTLNRTSGSTTLYKKKERPTKESSRYRSSHDDRRLSSKSMSVESLRRGRDNDGHVSRSVSMPRDPEKTAGWFSMNRNSKKKTATSSQRL